MSRKLIASQPEQTTKALPASTETDPIAAAVARLRGVEARAKELQAQSDEAITEAYAGIDRAMADRRAELEAIAAESLEKVHQAEYEVGAHEERVRRSEEEAQLADAALVDATDASAAVKKRDELIVASRRAQRDLHNARTDLESAERSYREKLEIWIPDPLGGPITRALTEVARCREHAARMFAAEDRALALVQPDEASVGLIRAALYASTYLEKAKSRIYEGICTQDAALAHVVGCVNATNDVRPQDTSPAHLERCLEAFASGTYKFVYLAEQAALKARQQQMAAGAARYEERIQAQKRLSSMKERHVDLTERGRTSAFHIGAVPRAEREKAVEQANQLAKEIEQLEHQIANWYAQPTPPPAA
jgi:hypothetical protein